MSDSQNAKNDRGAQGRDAEVKGKRSPREGDLSRPAEYGANEREQTIERERAGHTGLDEAGEVTDAEIEAREDRADRAETD